MSIISLTLLSFLYLIIPTTGLFINFSKFIHYDCVNESGNTYTETSNYHFNLNTLLPKLTSNTKIDYGFYNSSYGQNPNIVCAIRLYRGDLNPDSCRACLNKAAMLLPAKCPNQKEAMGYNDGYMNFNATINDLLQKLAKKAAASDSRHKFAASNEEGLFQQAIYGLVQRTLDLSEQDCGKMLEQAHRGTQ
ncbi:putative cysteine-rich repeat secretory protein 21 [Neltuma alba]|uniref:putative cysteine-rich repeat secretory protein 21 n=1 Tax=Neltuma alba TaxID=207710 RepID=UPI0010A4594B|nr:putative cysteine-rich repeat secretory protein 21 [Prosopis alba]